MVAKKYFTQNPALIYKEFATNLMQIFKWLPPKKF